MGSTCYVCESVLSVVTAQGKHRKALRVNFSSCTLQYGLKLDYLHGIGFFGLIFVALVFQMLSFLNLSLIPLRLIIIDVSFVR